VQNLCASSSGNRTKSESDTHALYVAKIDKSEGKMRFSEFLTEAKEAATKVGLEFQMMLPRTDDEIKTSLKGLVSGDVKVHAADIIKKLSNGWNVHADATIGEHGIELVSPRMPLNAALHSVTKICAWMDEHDAKTNDSTSLKVLISIPNINEKLDAVKLILLMENDHGGKAFDNYVGKFSAPQIEVITQKVKQTGRLPENLDDMERAAHNFLGIRATQNKMALGILELRIDGGAGYEKSPSDLKKKIFKLVNAVEVACDPMAEKSEYLRKLLELFDSSEEDVHVTKNEKIPSDLNRLYKLDANVNHAWKIFDKDQIHGDARHALIVMINTALKTTKDFKISLNLQEKTFFKKLARQVALQSTDVDSYYGHDHIARLDFKKEIGV